MGCDKFLDTKPSDFFEPDQYYETAEQLERALAGVYDPLGASELYSYMMSSYFGTEADLGYYNRSSAEGPQIYDYTPAHTRIRTTWQKLYDGIARANLLLANADKPEMNNAARNVIIGEAKFLRAYYYFLLVSNWGGVPLVLKPTEGPTNNSIARKTDREIYDFILEEMEDAEKKVLSIQAVGHAGRVTKSAVQGILARVCLYIAGNPLNDVSKYAEARDWAQKVMTAGHSLNPSYEQIFINYARDQYDINESIWEVEFWGNGSDNYSEAGWIGVRLGVATRDVSLGHSYGIIRPTERYYNLFDANDLRRDWTIAPFSYEGKSKVNHTGSIYERDIAKWRREYELDHSTSLSCQNYPLLRYSDVLLMFAEADVMANAGAQPSPEAIQAVEEVRNRAYGKLLPHELVKSIKVTGAGAGYKSAPTIAIIDGGGVEATAKATIADGKVTYIDVTNKGRLYTSAPTVVITGGDPTTAAKATATITTIAAADPSLTTVQKDDPVEFMKLIKDERSRELGFEALRKYDLIRWGDFLSVMKDTEIEISTSSAPSYATWAFQNVAQKHLLFPIPIRERALNKELTQNPGWQ
ncbi:RagB/SusD family nutrient uptake outer membrane protein [Sphingobacterium sp. SGG-5]|nr:RagB/SusD family nutrient uptake outer membrane protein [Sphingobacterium sp. SGG-5]